MAKQGRRVVAVVCVAGLLLSACGGGGDKEVSTATGQNNSGQQASSTTERDGESEESTTTDEPETTTTVAPRAAVEVAESGFSTYTVSYDNSTRATAGAVLKNSGNRKVTFFEVIFTFMDAAGKPVGTETTYVYAIEPDGVAYAGIDSVEITGAAATVEASAVFDDDSFYDGSIIPVTVESVTPQEYGDGVEVRGIAANEGSQVLESLSLTCVLRSGGKIVGSASGYLDTIVPGGSIAWDASGSVAADAAECAASKSS